MAIALLVPVAMLLLARRGGADAAFPLDDAWIHLTFARNLARHGAFAYFPGDPVTTGSTAPLFTLLEAAAFLVTSNERVIGFGLGLLAYAVFLVIARRDAGERFAHAGWAALPIGLLACDGRFGILAASGMETTLFLAALALVFLAWRRGDARLAGVAAGAALWTRPEAMLLAPILCVDALLKRRRPRHAFAGIAAFVLLLGAYLAFHRLTGPAWLPNTLAAKAAYYGGRTLSQFLREDVAATFGGGWLLLAPFVAYALWRAVRELFTPQPSAPRVELAWCAGVVVAYALMLPYSHRFNRYLLPALPGYAIAGVWGLREATTHAARLRTWAPVTVAAVLLVAQAVWFLPTFADYTAAARYHASHHVRTGRWLAVNSDSGAVVATHDIGAIAFESHRRVIDMAGLVTPEVIPHLRTPGYAAYLESLFVRRHVTYVAVLQDWQGVDGVLPVFDADAEPEWLRVYDWREKDAHLVSEAVLAGEREALAAMRAGRTDLAITRLRAVLATDPRAATAWSLYGAALDRAGHGGDAAAAFRTALAHFPALADARFGLAAGMVRVGALADARVQLDSLRATAPAHLGVDWLEARLITH